MYSTHRLLEKKNQRGKEWRSVGVWMIYNKFSNMPKLCRRLRNVREWNGTKTKKRGRKEKKYISHFFLPVSTSNSVKWLGNSIEMSLGSSTSFFTQFTFVSPTHSSILFAFSCFTSSSVFFYSTLCSFLSRFLTVSCWSTPPPPALLDTYPYPAPLPLRGRPAAVI